MGYYISFEKGPEFSAIPVVRGTPFSVTFTVKNTGDAVATASSDPFQQGFYVAYRFTNHYGGAVEESALLVDPLGPGESATRSLDTSFSAQEKFRLTLWADPSENIGGVSGNGQGDHATAEFSVV